MIDETEKPKENPPLTCRRCGLRLGPGLSELNCPKCALRRVLAPEPDLPDDEVRAALPKDEGQPRLRFLGDYELLELLAEGAMGQVYRARQVSLKRELAVKVLHRSYLASPRAVQRFRNEVEVVASLDHPNVLPIYEASEDGGIHFFGMKLVEGGSLAQSLARGEWVPTAGAPEASRQRKIARLMIAVSEAVHHAHQRGVIHRDLKPANILLDGNDTPLVGDFGLAKTMGADAKLSVTRELLGTPAYMAPEQLKGSDHTTLASDVYALGGVLYELLTNEPPFRAPNLEKLFESIRTLDPEHPARRHRGLAEDLCHVSLKCLNKEPGRRYETARALAEDLERWTAGEPILARPSTRVERWVKWCRRRPLVASLGAALIVAVMVGSLGVLWQYREVQSSNLQLARTVGTLRLEKANGLHAKGQTLEAVATLGRHLKEYPDDLASATRVGTWLSGNDLLLPVRALGPVGGPASAVRWHPDGTHLLILSLTADLLTREMTLWDVTEGRRVAGPRQIGTPLGDAQFSPDGKWLLTAFGRTVKLWNASTLVPVGNPLFPGNLQVAVAWHPDSSRLIAVERGRAALWDRATQERVQEFPHPATPNAAALSPDGRWVGVGGVSGVVHLWDLSTPGQAPFPMDVGGLVVGMFFNRDTSRLAAVVQRTQENGPQQGVVLLTLPEGKPLLTRWLGHQAFAGFSPDGQRLVITDAGMWATLVDAENGQTVADLAGSLVQYPVPFSPDGRWLAASRDMSDLVLLNPTNGSPVALPLHGARPVADTAFSGDGSRLAVANDQKEVLVWGLHRAGRRSIDLDGSGRTVAWSADGRWIASGDEGSRGQLFDSAQHLPQGTSIQHTGQVTVVRFDPQSTRVAYGAASGEVTLRPVTASETGPVRLHTGASLLALAFSPDGQTLTTLNARGGLGSWRVSDGASLASVADVHEGESEPVSRILGGLSYHPRGTRLVVTTDNDVATVWEARTLERVFALKHEGNVRQAQYSRDGRHLMTVSFDHFARVWDADTGQPLGPRLLHRQEVNAMDTSPTESLFATAGADQVIRFWELPTGRLTATASGHEEIIMALQFSPEGDRLASIAKDGTLRLWSVRSGLLLDEPVVGLGRLPRGTAWSPDGQRIAVAPTFGRVRVVDVPYLREPLPEWFPELATAVAGDVPGVSPGPALLGLRSRLEAIEGNGPYERWVRWFFSDRAPGQSPP